MASQTWINFFLYKKYPNRAKIKGLKLPFLKIYSTVWSWNLYLYICMHTYINMCTLVQTWKKLKVALGLLMNFGRLSPLITLRFAMHVYSKKDFLIYWVVKARATGVSQGCIDSCTVQSFTSVVAMYIPSWTNNSVAWFVALQRQAFTLFSFFFPSRGFSWDQKVCRFTPSFKAFWKFIVQISYFPPKLATHLIL